MNFRSRDLQRLSQKAAAPFIALAVISYFLYHSIQGDRGILAWLQLQKHLTVSVEHLDEFTAERKAIEERVQGLKPESINRDLLDQQVRLNLGHISFDEVMVLRHERQEPE